MEFFYTDNYSTNRKLEKVKNTLYTSMRGIVESLKAFHFAI